MKTRLFIFFAFCLLIGLQSCDEIANPNQQFVSDPADTGANSNRRAIVLEDYTGQTCSNCPDATKEAKRLEGLFGERLIVIAPHVGFFADPNPPEFPANFKTTVGNEIDQFFGINGVLPAGTVNRSRVNNLWKLSYINWASEVQKQSNQISPFLITDSITYDNVNRSVNLTVKVKVLANPGNGPFNLMVYYTEDSIVSPQLHKPPTGRVENYVHNYMLRGSLNGTWGEPLTPIPSVGQSLERNFSFVLPAQFKANHICLIPMIAVNTSNNREILQAKKIKLTP